MTERSVTKQLSVFCLLLALLLMQTFAGLHRGSTPLSSNQAGVTAQSEMRSHAEHNLHDDLFGALEGNSSCQLLDHVLEPPTATGELPCVNPLASQPEHLAEAVPVRISRFQLLGPPARGPPLQLS